MLKLSPLSCYVLYLFSNQLMYFDILFICNFKKIVRKVVSYIPPPPPEGEDSLFESVAKGINFSRYDEIMVECTGDNAPSKGLMR